MLQMLMLPTEAGSCRPLKGRPVCSKHLRVLATFVQLQITLGVNFFGPLYLTKLLLPVIKASAPSRIVWESSPAQTLADPNWDDIR